MYQHLACVHGTYTDSTKRATSIHTPNPFVPLLFHAKIQVRGESDDKFEGQKRGFSIVFLQLADVHRQETNEEDRYRICILGDRTRSYALDRDEAR